MSLILNFKALFLTTNWKARGTSFQCKPKFIIFLTKSHFLFLYFLSHSMALPSIYPEKTVIHTDTCTRMFTAALFAIARTWKQHKCPLTDEWIKEMWYIYTQWDITQPPKEQYWIICRDGSS